MHFIKQPEGKQKVSEILVPKILLDVLKEITSIREKTV